MVGCRVPSSAIQERNLIQREDSDRCNAMGGLIEDLELKVDCEAARRAPISLGGAEWEWERKTSGSDKDVDFRGAPRYDWDADQSGGHRKKEGTESPSCCPG